jgi:hypothetical protein
MSSELDRHQHAQLEFQVLNQARKIGVSESTKSYHIM